MIMLNVIFYYYYYNFTKSTKLKHVYNIIEIIWELKFLT
jgi:hypothetical protein